MPNVLLSVPHFEQSRDGTCLPTCVQMVLSFYGVNYSEEKLIKLLGTGQFGTPISRVSRLGKIGFSASLRMSSQDDLIVSLNAGIPIIVRVWTVMLPYWNSDTSHVVTVVGYDQENVYVNDPAFAHYPIIFSWDSLLAAWAEFDETAVLIQPS